MTEESQYLLVYSLFHDSFFQSSLIEPTRGHLLAKLTFKNIIYVLLTDSTLVNEWILNVFLTK